MLKEEKTITRCKRKNYHQRITIFKTIYFNKYEIKNKHYFEIGIRLFGWEFMITLKTINW